MKTQLNIKNPLEVFLGKPSKDFQRADLMLYMEENNIHMLNFRYPGEDGKLKTLNFAIENKAHLENVLTYGERVDGSSIFTYIDNGSSDLYVIPMYRTAFLDPFAEIPTLDVLCTYFTKDGEPLETEPHHVLTHAYAEFKKRTGYEFKILTELEYYIRAPKDELYKSTDQHGYHVSAPFCKYEYLRQEAIDILTSCGGIVKYGHAEVGTFYTKDYMYEQHEIEFLPEEPELSMMHLMLCKWILRMLCKRDELVVSWSPKITQGKAGSGLHYHMQVEKDGQNIMLTNGELSDVAKRVISGIMDMADVLTAFGNTVPSSYFRLVPGQEAPTYICWGYRNRSALVRVPLGWTVKTDMARLANPAETEVTDLNISRQTVEFRVPDGSADIYLMAAGLITAATRGLLDKDALVKCEKTLVKQYIFAPNFADRLKTLEQLPANCVQSAQHLLKKRDMLEAYGAFKPDFIDAYAERLMAYNDEALLGEVTKDQDKMAHIVEEFMDVM